MGSYGRQHPFNEDSTLNSVFNILFGQKVDLGKASDIILNEDNPNPHNNFVVTHFSGDGYGQNGLEKQEINVTERKVMENLREWEIEKVEYHPHLLDGYTLEVETVDAEKKIKTGKKHRDPYVMSVFREMSRITGPRT